MVPVNILDQFGLEFAWNGETRTVEINYPHQNITDIAYDDSGRFQEIHISTTGQVLTTSYFMDGELIGEQDKIIIDFENTSFDLPSYKVRDGKRTIDLIYGSIDEIVTYPVEESSRTRMEIKLLNRKGYDIFYDEDNQQVVVRFINSIRDIRTEQIYSSEAVVINTGEYPAYNVDYLNGKVVVDVVNALMRYKDGSEGSLDINEGGVDTISYSQFDTTGSTTFSEEDIVSRVVVNLDDDTSVEDVYIENIDNEIFIYVSGDPLNGFDYIKNGLDSANLTMNFTNMGQVDASYNASARLLTLKVDKDSLELSSMDVDIDDSIIDNININDVSNSEYVIKIKLSEGTTVAEMPGDGYANGVNLNFENEALKNSVWRNTLVVVDAGHGGYDSGAVGSKVTESKLTLLAAKELEKKLQSVGFKTYMIRDADVKIAPSYRMRVANDIGADLVVSIHINAAENPDAQGVEVLYAEEATGKKKEFAQILQNNLISALGSVNRGIVHRQNLYMCRVPTMPSALVELGFITNEAEQARMMTSAFMKTAAKAMLDAIIEFLE
jgi:N-acetylmuramoyl-L-alanine amidase